MSETDLLNNKDPNAPPAVKDPNAPPAAAGIPSSAPENFKPPKNSKAKPIGPHGLGTPIPAPVVEVSRGSKKKAR